MENHCTKARYCTLEKIGESISIEQVAVNYNYEKAAQQAELNHRNDWALWLRTGQI